MRKNHSSCFCVHSEMGSNVDADIPEVSINNPSINNPSINNPWSRSIHLSEPALFPPAAAALRPGGRDGRGERPEEAVRAARRLGEKTVGGRSEVRGHVTRNKRSATGFNNAALILYNDGIFNSETRCGSFTLVMIIKSIIFII